MSHKNCSCFQTDSGRKVYEALSDPRFSLRTLTGLVAATKLQESEVMLVLDSAFELGAVGRTQNRQRVAVFGLRN